MDTEKKEVTRLPSAETRLVRKPQGTYICILMGLIHMLFALFAWLADLSKDSKRVIEWKGTLFYQYIQVPISENNIPVFSARVWIVWIVRFFCLFAGVVFIMTAIWRRMSEGRIKYFLVIPFLLPTPFLIFFGVDTSDSICHYVPIDTNGNGSYGSHWVIYVPIFFTTISLFSYLCIAFPDRFSTIFAPFEEVNAVKNTNTVLP